MTIDDFIVEYDGLTRQRQQEGLSALFHIILNDLDDNYGLIQEILEVCNAAEAEDFFGTEGADI